MCEEVGESLMGRDNRQEALTYLLKQAEDQGYVTFDNIMDCADANSLPIKDFDWLSSAITTRGILVYDEAPINRTTLTQNEDEYDDYAQSDYDSVYDRIIELDDSLEQFVEKVRKIVPPQRRELDTLKYQALEGNQHARERMVEMHLRIALRIALQRAETYDMDIVDAVGEACAGLVTAVDRYDPDSNGAFGSYAGMWILQNISRRQSTSRSHVYYPVHKKESFFTSYPILKEMGYIDYPNEFEISDVVNELLLKTDLSEEQIFDALVATIPFDSLEGLFEDDAEEVSEILDLLICEEDVESQVAEILMKEAIGYVLETLTDREQRVLILRFGFDGGEARTLEEVGSMFNVTRERIRQIESKAITKLRDPSRSRKLKEFLD